VPDRPGRRDGTVRPIDVGDVFEKDPDLPSFVNDVLAAAEH
jgi:hypothetical protein